MGTQTNKLFLPLPMTIALWVQIFILVNDYCIMGTYFYLGQWLLNYGYIFLPWPMTIELWVHIFTLANDYCIMGTYFYLG